jgi:hypothetical protein
MGAIGGLTIGIIVTVSVIILAGIILLIVFLLPGSASSNSTTSGSGSSSFSNPFLYVDYANSTLPSDFNEIFSISNLNSLDVCKAACSVNPNCQFLQYTSGSGTCSLRKGLADTTYETTIVNNRGTQKFIDYPDTNIGQTNSYAVATAGGSTVCAGLCIEDTNCDWSVFGNGNCYKCAPTATSGSTLSFKIQ